MRLQPTAQVGQRAALTDEVVYYHIGLICGDVASEGRLEGPMWMSEIFDEEDEELMEAIEGSTIFPD